MKRLSTQITIILTALSEIHSSRTHHLTESVERIVIIVIVVLLLSDGRRPSRGKDGDQGYHEKGLKAPSRRQ